MCKSKFIASLGGLLLFSIFFTPSLLAQGDLLVTPRRVVFSGSQRVVELNLANTGQDTAQYNVSIIQYRMTEEGAFEEITEPDPGQFFADKNLRFFPRIVTLAPNEAQTVKMQVINQDRLAPGEYRSHVYFRAVPKETALGFENQNQDTTSLSVRLIPIFGITIPVIIQVGESDTEVSLSDLSVEAVNDTTNRLHMTFNRTGNMSVYGDLKVIHIAPDGSETNVGTVNGIAVYTPNALRKFRFDLDRTKNVNYKSGKIRITYSAQSDVAPKTFATAELNL
ncbi:MAG: hypothetical protein WC396_02350 [Bacteroidales bacterium]|jgi:P pilus assembly chaperone PapD|nr:hypothetical protein [Bacteroidales bacterium]MDD4257578.1 hypothetical protein [Bacteroidales bacterium]MDD4655630.1 hypothetical protein [Bacteroidales bacterium]